MNSVNKDPAPTEGRRERKRRETRRRIAETAMALFQERGFASVTIDEIAETADISKPTFFNYFSAKEDVVLAWQDRFAARLAHEITAQPESEDLPSALEAAMIAALVGSATPESFAVTDLIRQTPALAARNQAKYLYLEEAIADALAAREPDRTPREIKLLGMMAVGALRIGTDEWFARGNGSPAQMEKFTSSVFRSLWKVLADITIK